MSEAPAPLLIRMPRTLALIGDYSPDVVAHRAIPHALELAQAASGSALLWRWVSTRDLQQPDHDLADATGIWVVPASPYENTPGVLAAIRFARETRRPLLGTCGGFQHMLIEFARNVVGLATADNAETHPDAECLVVTPLACSLVEKSGRVHFAPGSRLRDIYGADTAQEAYHCRYGFNPEHRAAFEHAGLRFTAFAETGLPSEALAKAGDIRGAELPPSVHPFFIGTLFQPERTALKGELPPVVRAFVQAVLASPHL